MIGKLVMAEVAAALPVVRRAVTHPVAVSLPYVGIGFLFLLLSLGFYRDGLHASPSSLSSDQFNILPVCAKKDNPQLYQGDLIVGDLKGVAYYTPAFVDSVRLLSLPDRNYLQGLNRLVLLSTFIYLWGWWLLFSLWGDKWLAAVGAFFARGILWPPGNELWGIAGMWTMVPRTPFLALLPWVLWSWIRFRRSRYGWVLTCLGCGLMVNVHPVSGLAVVIGLLLAEAAWTIREEKNISTAITKFVAGGIAVTVGMLPFIWTYLSKLGGVQGVTAAELDQAMELRLKPLFFQPELYFKAWLERPSLLVLVLAPWVCCLFIPRRLLAKHKSLLLALGVFSLGCLLTSLAPFPLESMLRRLGYHPRFAFQLVRTAKYVIAPSIILSFILVSLAVARVQLRYRYGKALVTGFACCAILITLIARWPVFDRVPLLGDDFARFLWPSWVTGSASNPGSVEMDNLLKWIRENTPADAKFVGPRQIRIGALRSVIHDWAGAVILIEGDPAGYVKAARRESELRSPAYQDPTKRANLIAGWGADYWVSTTVVPNLPIVYRDSVWFVYSLESLAAQADSLAGNENKGHLQATNLRK